VNSETLVLDAAAHPADLVRELRELIPAGGSVSERVAEIIAEVRAGGDAAVLEHTRRLDTGGAVPLPLRVPAETLRDAGERLAPELRESLELAIENVSAVARATLTAPRTVSTRGAEVVVREEPVARAAVYVPAGRAPYPSTVVMGVATARAAGVGEVAVCAPPGRDGEVDGIVLGACALLGAQTVYRMGGAHAIAALAWGTESVEGVEVIVGPGNLWVQEAKRQLSGEVGIDSFAGPSDLLILADPGSDPEPLALDLLAQAEHGPGTLVLAASSSVELLADLAARLQSGPESDAVARLVELAAMADGLALAQSFAPEHLQLVGPQAEALADRVTHAGCVFLGAGAGTAFGDYVAGSNHVLPTGGAARFASALSARTFRRTFTQVRITDPAALARAAAPLARAEGFELHARSMEIRA
jgi:histidinol dehydrogenase